jgi:hypothetical protein
MKKPAPKPAKAAAGKSQCERLIEAAGARGATTTKVRSRKG